MKPRFDERFPTLHSASDALADPTVRPRRDLCRLGCLAIQVFQRCLRRPRLFRLQGPFPFMRRTASKSFRPPRMADLAVQAELELVWAHHGLARTGTLYGLSFGVGLESP